jgi:AcrR family transcriptional regulator
MGSTEQLGPRRPYSSPSRDAAARLTRQRILEAAAGLFLDSGYTTTSVRSIAKAAGVAEKTVYLQFETKPAILKSLVDAAIMGADHGVPTVRSPWFLEVLEEGRLERKVQLLAVGTTALHERTGALFAVAREAASVDPQVRTLWSRGKRRHRADMATMAESFAGHGLLPAGLDAAWATEVLYVLLGPENWDLLRRELGHGEGHYREWLSTTLMACFSGRGR